MNHRRSIVVLFAALQTINAFAQDHLPIPEGRLGFPLGTYVEIEGVRAEKGKVGVNTLLVERINEKRLEEPIGVWIENVDELPKQKK